MKMSMKNQIQVLKFDIFFKALHSQQLAQKYTKQL